MLIPLGNSSNDSSVLLSIPAQKQIAIFENDAAVPMTLDFGVVTD